MGITVTDLRIVLVLQSSVSLYFCNLNRIALVCSITYISSRCPMYDTLPQSYSHMIDPTILSIIATFCLYGGFPFVRRTSM